MKTVDFKSLVIGGLLVLLVLCLVGAVPWMPTDYYRRFVIGTTDKEAFILDTASGQAWIYETYQNYGFQYTRADAFFAPKTEVDVVPVEPNATTP